MFQRPTDAFRPRPTLAMTSVTHVVQDGLALSINVILPVLAVSFGLSYAQVGMLKGFEKAVQAGLEFASGWLSDWAGETRLLVVGLVLSALGYALLSVAPGLLAIAMCLLFVGAGTALHHAPSSSLIANAHADLEGKSGRAGALGLYNASGDVGKLAFTGLFSLGTGMGLAWSQISLVYGAMALLAAILVWIIARGARESARRTSEEIDAKSSAGGDRNAAVAETQGWGILHKRAFSGIVAASMVDSAVQSSLFLFTAFLLLEKGLSLPIAMAGTVVLLTGGVFGKASCGYLSERMGATRAFTAIQILTAVGLLVVTVAPSWATMVLLLPLGAVAQGSSSITYGLAASCIHSKRMARGYALLYSVGTLASVVSPLVLGWVADWYGLGTTMVLMAAIVLFSIPPMIILKKDMTEAQAA